jgi:hypothetical protein
LIPRLFAAEMSSFEPTQRNVVLKYRTTLHTVTKTLIDKDKARTTILHYESPPDGDRTITVTITPDSGDSAKFVQVMRAGSSEPLLAEIQEALDDIHSIVGC